MVGQWIKELSTVLGPYILEISLGFLVLLFLYIFIRYHIFLVCPLLREYKGFADYLAPLPNQDESNEYHTSTYIKNLKSKSPLVSIWNDYLLNRDTEPGLDSFFNENTMVELPAKKDQTTAQPSMLLTVGLLLSLVSFLLPFASSESNVDLHTILYPAINQVIFIAVFTVLLAFLLDRLNKSLFGKIKDRVYEINKQVHRKLVQKTETRQNDQLLERFAASLDNMSSSLSAYAQYNSDIQRTGMNQMADSFLESLNGGMHGQLRTLADSFQSFYHIQTQSIEQTQALVNELVKGVEQQKGINQASESIIASIADYHKDITAGSQHLTGTLKELEQLSEALNSMVSFNGEALETIKAERGNLKEEYGKYIQGLYGLIKDYQKETSGELEKAMTRFVEVSEKSYGKLEGATTKTMDTWVGSSRSIMQGIEEQSRNLNSVSREISLRLNELNGSLKETMKEFTKAVEQGTGKTLTEFDEGLTEITTRLSGTISEIRDSIDDLPVVINSLKNHLE